MPSPTMIPLTGTREIRMKPVTTVPTIAPTVPMPDSRPTTRPVWSSELSRSLVTIGVIADRNVPGMTMPRPATTISRIVPPSIDPAARTAGGVAATATPRWPAAAR